jgi:hypothetical protein
MRVPRVRSTVRRMMVAVAVVALATRLEMWRRRSPYCHHQALRCASAGRSHLWLAESHERIAARYRRHPEDPQGVVRYDIEQSVLFMQAARSERAKARRSADRAEAFRRAARYPCSPMPPEGDDPLESIRIDRLERTAPPSLDQRAGSDPIGRRPGERLSFSGR